MRLNLYYTEIFLLPFSIVYGNYEDSTQGPKEIDHSHSWHINTIFSATAGVIGLICLVAIAIFTICRIQMRRETLRQMLNHPVDSHALRNMHNVRYVNHNTAIPHSSYAGLLLQESIAEQTPRNVSINLSVLLNGVSESDALMVGPPPYSEVDESAVEDGAPPPPYSTLDRTTAHKNQGANNH